MSEPTRPGLRARLTATAVDVLPDLAALAGAAAITRGAELAWHPAGYLVGGVFLLTGSWLFARAGS